jgi:hypothetical protein
MLLTEGKKSKGGTKEKKKKKKKKNRQPSSYSRGSLKQTSSMHYNGHKIGNRSGKDTMLHER